MNVLSWAVFLVCVCLSAGLSQIRWRRGTIHQEYRRRYRLPTDPSHGQKWYEERLLVVMVGLFAFTANAEKFNFDFLTIVASAVLWLMFFRYIELWFGRDAPE